MKVTNEDSEDAFSGETVPLDIKGSDRIKDLIIANTRKNYATSRAVVEKQLNKLFGVIDQPADKAVKSKVTISRKMGNESRKNTHKPVRKSLQN